MFNDEGFMMQCNDGTYRICEDGCDGEREMLGKLQIPYLETQHTLFQTAGLVCLKFV